MAYTYKTKLAYRSNYGAARKASQIKYFAIHYTGNDGDTDENNGAYFSRQYVGASAHYFIDDDSVTNSVPDLYVAYSVGSNGLLDQGSAYRSEGAKFWGKCNNTNSLSFELCDPIRGGGIKLSKATRKNAVQFIAKKMVEYDIDTDHVIRHFDVNGKLCPIYFVTDEADWLKFKKELSDEVKNLTKGKKEETEEKTTKYSGSLPTLPARGYFDAWDDSEQVKHLQNFLNWFGGYGLKVDGIVGPKTIAAVKEFQKATGLTADGLFGSDSLKKARTYSIQLQNQGKSYSGTFPSLPARGYFKKGDTSTQVKNLQRFLNWFGGFGLIVDGIIGNKTIEVVKAFQKKTGLLVDGLFGADSLKKAKAWKK